ncbi:hypothetical protein SAMN04487983_102291 [Streptomyces sp. yr375]|uniref:hypothetical protein n=1 Tax=Streptomyces sp. yr375 TaxID=1761906 RepID=UPI0008D135C4|nr:hypothetical protein [Streptomyces sp. yr375]SER79988.1 hypothetical protein SAMN04487983_102291 [Streptomyces sp. yr375]
MSGTEEQGDVEFEERMRELLAEDAYTIRPSPAPYPAIRRRGLAERRRRAAVTGAALATLAAVPVGAYAVAGGSGGRASDTAAPKPSVSAPRSPATASPGTPAGPQQPATKGQLLDGITFTQAADGLRKCLDRDQLSAPTAFAGQDLGEAADYRIVLAIRSTGDSNAPGDGMYVVATKERPAGFRVICNIRSGTAGGINSGTNEGGSPESGPVVPDINGGKLYQESFLDKGDWKLPFRWGAVGTVEPSVTKVTVSYGDGDPVTAALDHGWFVAAGILRQQVTLAPHIKGYDTTGKLVYDSDDDTAYERTLP